MVGRHDFQQFVGMCFDRTFFVEVRNCSNHDVIMGLIWTNTRFVADYATSVAGGVLKCEPIGITTVIRLR